MARKKLNRKKLNAQIPVYTGAIHSEEIGMQLFTYNSEKYDEDLNYSIRFLPNSPLIITNTG